MLCDSCINYIGESISWDHLVTHSGYDIWLASQIYETHILWESHSMRLSLYNNFSDHRGTLIKFIWVKMEGEDACQLKITIPRLSEMDGDSNLSNNIEHWTIKWASLSNADGPNAPPCKLKLHLITFSSCGPALPGALRTCICYKFLFPKNLLSLHYINPSDMLWHEL